MTAIRRTPHRQRDHRLTAALIVAGLVLLFGAVTTFAPSRGTVAESTAQDPQARPSGVPTFPFLLVPVPEAARPVEEFVPSPDPAADPRKHSDEMRDTEVRQRLLEAGKLMDDGRYGEAVKPLARAIELRRNYPAPYVNMGYAQLGLGNLESAHEAFMRAIDLKPNEARAYYGLGIVYDRSGDFAAATGAMRGFLHLTTESDPFNPAVTRARSALWEWEAKLGRGPWGPTRGIPPGLTEDELKRDGHGVGMLAPQPDGTSRVQPRPPEHFLGAPTQ